MRFESVLIDVDRLHETLEQAFGEKIDTKTVKQAIDSGEIAVVQYGPKPQAVGESVQAFLDRLTAEAREASSRAYMIRHRRERQAGEAVDRAHEKMDRIVRARNAILDERDRAIDREARARVEAEDQAARAARTTRKGRKR